MTEVTELVLSQDVTEHDVSILPTFVFDSEEIFVVTQNMFLDFDLKVDKKRAELLLTDFSRYLATRFPMLCQKKHLVFKYQQSPGCFFP